MIIKQIYTFLDCIAGLVANQKTFVFILMTKSIYLYMYIYVYTETKKTSKFNIRNEEVGWMDGG